jgi:hypothetical protein
VARDLINGLKMGRWPRIIVRILRRDRKMSEEEGRKLI